MADATKTITFRHGWGALTSLLIASPTWLSMLLKRTKLDLSQGEVALQVALAAAALFLYGAYVITRSPLRARLVIDADGLRVGPWMNAVLPWSAISGVAALNEPRRRTLRLFLRPGAMASLRPRGRPTIASRSARGYAKWLENAFDNRIDINFRTVLRPQKSLDEAIAFCTRGIGAAAPRVFYTDLADNFPRREPLRGAALIFAALAFGACVAAGGAYWRARPLMEEAPFATDGRPAFSVLFLGNSRIFTHDMPRMVRDIADSAHSPLRYDVAMRAWANATLSEHEADPGDRAALAKHWDLVILQPHSGAFADADKSRRFASAGEDLAKRAAASGSRVAFFANWTLGRQFFVGDPRWVENGPSVYGERIESHVRELAARTTSDVIDLMRPFAASAYLNPEIALTSDGNHPTIAGAFLAALIIYVHVSHADVDKVVYRPPGLGDADAQKLKAVVKRLSADGAAI